MCILKGVRKLPPAYAAIYDIEKNTLKTWQYWTLPCPEEDNGKYSEAELVDELEYLMEDSVRLRLVSDVPLGIFLSGGIDSSLTAAMAVKCSSTPVKTFTISFPGAGKYDESGYAKIIAGHFKTEHYVLRGNENILDTLEQVTPFIDEPIGDSSLLPTYLLSKLARRHVTVALGGDGGDELFGGYGHYGQALRDKNKLRYIPDSLLRVTAKISGRLPPGIKGRNRLCSLKGGYLEENIWGNPYFDLNLRKKIFSKKTLKDINSIINVPEKWKTDLLSKGFDDIDKLTRLDFSSYLPEDIMTKVDRAGMACSLEVRAPWLDYRIIEFAFRKVPSKYKVSNGETRILQKRLAERLLPKDLDLTRKQGFSVPMDEWFRVFVPSCLNKSNLNSVLCEEYIDSLIQGHLKGRTNGARLFALMMLELGVKNIGLSV
jgi:asparagine synthase (glutamine-hydrolysing)